MNVLFKDFIRELSNVDTPIKGAVGRIQFKVHH